MAQPSNPDQQLVQKAVNGNRKAFTSLFNRYFQSVYNYALMLSHDPALAEDLTQEAFIRAHANLGSLGPPWNFRSWIFRLTRNYFIDLIRKDRNVDPLEEDTPVRSTGPGPERETMSREAADRVQNTLNKLTPQNREILVLRELNQFSYAEIGEILDIGDSNVKVSLHRAREAFQESYGIQLLLEDPEGECKEVTALLEALHDNEELLDREQFVREHLKVCPECRERRQMLIAQSVALGAFIPVIPPQALAERILNKTASPLQGPAVQKPSLIKGIFGYGGGAIVLGAMVWIVYSLIFNTQMILPNFPCSENLPPTPEVLALPAPTEAAAEVPPPPPPPPSVSDRCKLFEDLETSVMLLSIRPEDMILPVYFKMEGGILGLSVELPDYPQPWEYYADLGPIELSDFSQQGFNDRIYFNFPIMDTMPGTIQDIHLYLKGCDDPIISWNGVSIPELLLPEDPAPENDSLICTKDLSRTSCEAAGGIYHQPMTVPSICECP
jgi:RNA polymerase sigma factor (sigma-70 family)